MSPFVFQLLAALAAALAVGLVLWPIARARRRGLYAALVVAAAVLTVGLYRLLGEPAALDPAATAPPSSLEDGVRQLQAALARDPDRADGWALLGRSQMELGRADEGAKAYQRAVELAPQDSGLLAEAAQARALADPQHLFDETGRGWLQRARELDPDNQRVRWLWGVVQRQQGDNAGAVQTWESLLPGIDPAAASALREQIAAARTAAGLPAPAAPADAAADTPAAAASGLPVRVELDPQWAARVRLDPDATVFVIARVPGEPMPVAVQRHRLSALPLQITLGDGDSPMPTRKLSSLQQVEVLARLSASGSANRQPDDLESPVQPVSLPASAPVVLRLGGTAD